MNQLPNKQRALIITLLVEGNSIRGTARIAGVHQDTVSKILKKVGPVCEKFHNEKVINIDVSLAGIESDEVWSFIYCRDKHVKSKKLNHGDVYTWIAIARSSRLVVSWLSSGGRDIPHATKFMRQLKRKLNGNRVQITTDLPPAYNDTIATTFAGTADYARIKKIYKAEKATEVRSTGHRFNAEKCVKSEKKIISGTPSLKNISTSYVERQNLTLRQSCRRFARDTNAFSKKFEFHCHAIALHFVYYNFCRINWTPALRCKPAMAAGITDDIMTPEDIVKLAYD